MYRFHGDTFYRLARGLETLANLEGTEDAIEDATKQPLIEELKGLIDKFDEMGMPLSALYLQRMRNQMVEPDCTFKYIKDHISILQERIQDELSSILFMRIPNSKLDFYQKSDLFGGNVVVNFPSALLDVEEAGKCFAVGRYTACAFHLLRVVEVGVKAFGTGLGIMAQITAAQPSWGDVLRETWKEMKRLNASGDPTWTPEKKSFFENVQSDLHIVKTAWRNPTMHVENTYDEERAEDIFNAVKSWMRHLAKHLDESGTFTP